MNKIPTTIPLTVGGEHKVTHRTTLSLATGKLVGYILASRPTGARYDVGDRVDLAGTYWWDRRPSGSRIASLLGRAASLAVVAWLIGSTVAGNSRTCSYKDYTGRVYSVVQSASETCDPSIQVPSC